MTSGTEFARGSTVDVRVVIQPPGEERDAASMTEAYDHEGVMVHWAVRRRAELASIAACPGGSASRGSASRRINTGSRLADLNGSYWARRSRSSIAREQWEVAVPLDELLAELPDDADFQLRRRVAARPP